MGGKGIRRKRDAGEIQPEKDQKLIQKLSPCFRYKNSQKVQRVEAHDRGNVVPHSDRKIKSRRRKISVQDLLNSFRFPTKTVFLVDMGFYSEDDLGLYREDGKHFVIPIPDSVTISKAMRSSIIFSGTCKVAFSMGECRKTLD